MEQNKNPDSPWSLDSDTAPRQEIVPLHTAHMPEFVDPLEPRHPDNSLTETRHLRHDGWTPEKKRLFLERFAECGVIVEACLAAGMSARSAYNLRDRDPLFAAGFEAACVKARGPLADEAYSRARNGVVERIYKDGVIVAEKHRYDNRLTMAVLARLDSRIDRAEEKGAAHLALVERWEDYLDAVGEDRREDGLAIFQPPEPPAPPEPVPGPGGNAGHRELHELHLGEEAGFDDDGLHVWEDEDGWWTHFPPPEGFDGEEEGSWDDDEYRRRLSPAEQAVIDSDLAEEDAEEAKEKAEDRAAAEARRDEYFGIDPAPAVESDGPATTPSCTPPPPSATAEPGGADQSGAPALSSLDGGAPMSNTILLIHGAWLNSASWAAVKARYEAKGFTVVAPDWPYDDRSPEELRAQPDEKLAGLGIAEILDHYHRIIGQCPEEPILIGHSAGGVFVQHLLDRGLGVAGVAVDPAPTPGVALGPHSIVSALPVFFDWGSWKKSETMSRKFFRTRFAQLVPEDQADAAYDQYIVPTPGKVYWDGIVHKTPINWDNPDRAPLLLVGGELDLIADASMTRAIYEKQSRAPSLTELKIFPGRSHWTLLDPGWEEVADYALDWAVRNARPARQRPSAGEGPVLQAT